MAHLTKDFLDVWSKVLDKAAQGLDLKDPEDRAAFRGNVEASFRNALMSVPKELAQALGVKAKGGNSRSSWSRAVAEAYIEGKRLPKEASLIERVASQYQMRRLAAFLNVNDIIFYGKYKNKKGRIVRFTTNEKGQPQVEIEPIPKGRKKNKVMGLFKIWSARALEEAKIQKEQEEQKEASTMDSLTRRIADTWKVRSSLGRGDTVEVGDVRIHRYSDNFTITDLTFAGKRGKKVQVMSISPSYYYKGKPEDWMENMSKALVEYRKYDQVKAFIKDLLHDFPGEINIEERSERGVDVTPGGFRPLHVTGKGVKIEVDYKDFSVVNVDDQFNLPTCIPAIQGGLKSIPVFYRWVQDNMSAIKSMSFQDVLKAMDSLDVKYHQYCAID